jgi:hypothetical protein
MRRTLMTGDKTRKPPARPSEVALRPSRASTIAARLAETFHHEEALWLRAERPGPDRISESTFVRVLRVREQGTAALWKAVAAGHVSVNAAFRLLKEPPERQDEIAAHPELLRRAGRPRKQIGK